MNSSLSQLDGLPTRYQLGADLDAGIVEPFRAWRAGLRLSGPGDASFDPRERIDVLVRRLVGGIEWPAPVTQVEGWWEAPSITLRSDRFFWPPGEVVEKSWGKYLDGLGDKYGTIRLVTDSYTWEPWDPPWEKAGLFGWRIEVDWEQATQQFRRVEVEVHFGPSDADCDRAADLLTAELREWVTDEPGLWSGSVSVETGPFPLDLLDLRLGGDRWDRWVDGYYWAVALMPSHLEHLGSVEWVAKSAPVESAEVVKTPDGGEAVLCRLTERASAQTIEHMRPWSQFVGPVLSPGALTDEHAPKGELDRETMQHGPARPLPRFAFVGPVSFHSCGLVIRHGLTGPWGRHEGLRDVPVVWPSFDPHDPGAFEESVGDVEAPAVWIYPGDTFDRERDNDVLLAHVDLWAQVAGSGQVNGTDAVLVSVTTYTWHTDDEGVDALTFQCEFDGDPTVLVERLALAAQAYDSAGFPDSGIEEGARLHIDRLEVR